MPITSGIYSSSSWSTAGLTRDRNAGTTPARPAQGGESANQRSHQAHPTRRSWSAGASIAAAMPPSAAPPSAPGSRRPRSLRRASRADARPGRKRPTAAVATRRPRSHHRLPSRRNCSGIAQGNGTGFSVASRRARIRRQGDRRARVLRSKALAAGRRPDNGLQVPRDDAALKRPHRSRARQARSRSHSAAISSSE